MVINTETEFSFSSAALFENEKNCIFDRFCCFRPQPFTVVGGGTRFFVKQLNFVSSYFENGWSYDQSVCAILLVIQ